MENKSIRNKIDMTYGMLINRDNRYNSKDYKNFKYINIMSTDNRPIIVENITYKNFLKLKERMKKEKVEIGIKYALRNEYEQYDLYEQFCIKYGKDYANKIVCPVGASEHHTGLALDIEVQVDGQWITNNENINITEPILRKMHPLLHNYGFILRYPKDKEKITNVPYEPWHIRYVGEQFARYLYENKLLLEDFYKIKN